MNYINPSDIDKYKSEHECIEHWQLRRQFLLAHCEKYPEDQLLCLAQVFTNVEFLGCKYPNETMKLVAELSEDIVGDYRSKQKNRLQRTFVKASDAASAKSKKPSQNSEPKTLFVKASESTTQKNKEKSKAESNLLSLKKENFKIKINNEYAKKRNINTNIVLFEYPNDTPQSIIARAASTFKIAVEWKFSMAANNKCLCTLHFNQKVLAEALGFSKKAAKEQASAVGLDKIRSTYYTIKVLQNVIPSESDVTKEDLNNVAVKNLKNDSIGLKLMKLMGWSGGGLGKESQGIVEPVESVRNMTKEGLGLKSGSCNIALFKKKCQETLQNYACTNMKTDLVFNPSFTSDERAIIHQIAQQIGLKSHSYGPKNKRTLIVSRKIHPKELVSELIELGGSTEKYQLIEPSGK